MLLHRVFPHLPAAAAGEPGHPLYVHPDQGTGRWDNRGLYLALYAASEATGAVGETFAHRSRWNEGMLPFPQLPGAVRTLVTYELDQDRHPLLDLDHTQTLVDYGLRPTDVVIRNRPRTQDTARRIYDTGRYAGLSWWSMHRPEWRLHVLWMLDGLIVRRIEPLPGHPALIDAAARLGKDLDPALHTPPATPS